MLEIKKTYVTDSKKRPIAVQVDIQTFEKMEQLLEDYALGQFINENDPDDVLSVAEAKAYYESLGQKKAGMNIQVNRAFLRELAKLPVKERLKVEKLLFEEIESYKSLAQIPNFKKIERLSEFL